MKLAVMICAALALAPGFSVATECSQPEPVTNDVCASAIPLGANPDNVWIMGNTELATHDYDLGHDNSCTGAQSRGADVVYSFTVDPSCVTTVFLWLCDDVQWYDQSLYMTTDCSDMLSDCRGRDWPCVDGVCPGENAVWANSSSQTETVYLVLDGKYPSSHGAWIVDIFTDCVVPVENTSWGRIKSTYRERP